MICARCGEHTTRYRLTQRYCPACQREVEAIVRRSQRPRRFRFGADITPWVGGGRWWPA